ncbi:hypothetical protein PIB30_075276 [Stylosanthes scabra]|uniref:Uncharacterized protein n=1 Tax=Stylosanthes scabra TaxID=79078 RepID=A0ABU6XMV4_9FABA|nr:hypothetical protein [Stylosanthes scabra]
MLNWRKASSPDSNSWLLQSWPPKPRDQGGELGGRTSSNKFRHHLRRDYSQDSLFLAHSSSNSSVSVPKRDELVLADATVNGKSDFTRWLPCCLLFWQLGLLRLLAGLSWSPFSKEDGAIEPEVLLLHRVCITITTT